MATFAQPQPVGRRKGRTRASTARTAPSALRLSNKKVLVTGATGPTGRLICAALSARGASVRALIRPKTYMRDRRRVQAVRELCPSVEYAMGDLRDMPSIEAAVRGCHGIVSCAGSSNFEGGDPNRPEVVDFVGVRRLTECFVDAQMEQELAIMIMGEIGGDVMRGAVVAEELADVTRFVLVSSLGVTRPERFPQLDAMGNILRYKLCGEDALRESSCPFTIVRPGGFVDVPAGESGVIVDQGDRIAGSISRADVAEICADAIFRKSATNVTFECVGSFGTDGSGKQRFEPHMFDELVPDGA